MSTPFKIKELKLLSGSTVPWLAFGTGTALYSSNCTDAVKLALKAGFRHLDTAQMYKNELYMGKAIEWALSKEGDGLGLGREDLFITTKLYTLEPGQTVEDSLKESLAKLKVQWVNLFLIHVPTAYLEREGKLEQVWREMISVKEKGLAKIVGVSNFNKVHLESLIGLGIGKPEVNQIEYHPLVAKKLGPLLQFSKDQGILTASYGGLTPILPDRANDLPETVRSQISGVLDKLAKARGASVTQNQILLKWLEKQGILAVTTSSKESRLKEYLATQSLPDLTDEEEQAVLDATGESHLRAFSYFRWMDEEGETKKEEQTA